MGFSNNKRKSRDEEEEEDYALSFPMDKLNDDILERVLSWLPTSSYFRLTCVCKRWRSTESSKSFKLACAQIPFRDPWFFMVDNDHDSSSSFFFDSADKTWKILNNHRLLRRDFIPVASSVGLLCFRSSVSGDFLLRNPLTGSSREIPSLHNNNKPLQAVAMAANLSPSGYKLVTISGEIPNLSFRIYKSSSDSWSKAEELKHKDPSLHDDDDDEDDDYDYDYDGDDDDDDDDDDVGIVYFLSKTGHVVVASNKLQRSLSKQYSSVITVKDNVETLYFLSFTGTIIACDLTNQCFNELPKLIPPCQEYSIDLVECNGTMFVILLSEFYETASLRIWKLENNEWVHVGMLPPAMSHELYGKKGDINCVGGGRNKILVCFNANHPCVCFGYFVYDIVEEEWSSLPRCFKDGEAVDFVSALSFQPRIEATA